jgi:chromate transporter
MHRMLVEERRWISEGRFLHALNFCMLLPGPEAQQLAIYIGWLLHGVRGGIVAGVLFVLPGFFAILALSTIYALFHETAWLASVFFGLKAAVLAIVIEAVVRIGSRALKGPAAIALAAAAFVGIFALHVPFPLIVLGAGVLGVFAAPVFAGANTHGTEESDGLRDPPAPTSGHAVRTIAAWGGLWAAPVVLVGLVFGWDSIYAGLSGFFSQMAVVTFGGAYAVLAYVGAAAVSDYHWLAPGQMLDGLALAETTPGPLILVLTFVGFLAAYANPGALPPFVGGVLGAVLTTWVTFVPCFLWIFLGAPYVERLRGNQRLSAGLAAITAAVVGVILNLAIFLGLHVLFREVSTLSLGWFSPAWPVWSTLDPAALALFLVALAALLWFRLGIAWTLLITGVLGLALKLVI